MTLFISRGCWDSLPAGDSRLSELCEVKDFEASEYLIKAVCYEIALQIGPNIEHGSDTPRTSITPAEKP